MVALPFVFSAFPVPLIAIRGLSVPTRPRAKAGIYLTMSARDCFWYYVSWDAIRASCLVKCGVSLV